MATAFAQKLADIALDQYNTYKNNEETDPVLSAQIKKYWEYIGLDFPGVETPWSAVFISWCVKQAGATSSEFHFSDAHSVFVYHAIQNRKAGTGVFQGFGFNEVSPAVGDILQNNRDGHHYDYQFASDNAEYSSHSAIVIEVGTDAQGDYIITVGGNESNSIRTKTIRLNDNGKIPQRDASPFICLVKNLK